MRAVREIRPPGVYPAADEPRAKPLTVSDTRVAGFVGLASRGPLDEPVLLGGWNEFLDIYGHSNESYLARAVEGFFLNGGQTCYVVRVAHRARPGADGKVTLGPEHAACAERVAKDGWDKPTLRVRAMNEGRWGNNIWVRFQQTTAARTLLTLDLEVGSGEARVNSVKGFERGALVRIYDRENSDYVVVTEVDDRIIRWGAATPIVRRYRAAGPTYLEVLEFEVFASLKDRREVFRGLQMSPLSRRYAPRIINDESQLVRLEDLQSPAPLPHNLPVAEPASKLTGGRDGIDVLTAEDFVGYDHGPGDRTGLMALGAVDQVAMLAVPDIMIAYQRTPGPQADRDVQRVQDAMIDLCENLKDRFAILDAPPTKDIEEVRKWRRRLNSSFAAMYYPWIAIDSASARAGDVPAVGPRRRRRRALRHARGRTQGAGERGHHGRRRPHAEHERGSPRPLELRRHQRRARVPRPRHPRVGRAHDQRRARLALHQRAPDRSSCCVARSRRARSGRCSSRTSRAPGSGSRRTSTSSSRSCGPTAISRARRRRSRTSSSATRRPTRRDARDAGQM